MSFRSMNLKTKKIVLLSVCLAVVLCVVTFFAVWNYKTRLSVLFVNMPESVQTALTAQVLDIAKRPPVFKTFKGDSADLNKSAKKMDLVFAYNGQAGYNLKNFAKKLPSALIQTVPDSFFNAGQNAYPILLDHYGIFYYNRVRQGAKLKYPATYTEFEAYLKKIKSVVEIPLFVAGGSDSRLLAFVGAIVEGAFGSDAYFNFINALKSYKTMDELLTVNLSSEKTVKDAFDILLDFERKGYLHTAWLGAKAGELKTYALDARFGIAFASLLDFRALGSMMGQGYSMDRMPVLNTRVKHGMIAPLIQIFCTSDKKVAMETVTSFSMVQVQNKISDTTMLALASAFAPSYDKEADDVRFLAASCAAGPLSDPLVAAFELDENRGKSFCRDLRSYLRIYQ